MIGSEEFWKTEADAPLLNRNADFVSKENAAEMIERARKLVDLIESGAGTDVSIELVPDCGDEGARRIFVLDAERTFEAMMLFLEAFLEKKDTFLFQFGLALLKNVQPDLVATKDVSKTLAILRLDQSLYPNTKQAEGSDQPGSFFTRIVEDAINFDLGDADIEKLREEAMEEMRLEEEKRKEREKQLGLDSDDEIVFSDEEDE